MDILKDNKSVTYGVDEASRHLTFVLSLRQTNCVNCLGGDHHGSTLRLLHAFVRFRPFMQPRHYLSDAAGVVAPDEADLGGALAEGLEAHQVVGVDHPAGELPDRPDRHVPQHPHRQAGQVWPGCRLDREAIQDGPGAVLRLPIYAWLTVANEGR